MAPKQSKGTSPKITNVVCTVQLGCPVNLEKICHSGYRFVEHTKGKKFTEVVTLRLRGRSSCCRIFKNGKLVCMGETSEDEAKLAARRFARIVQKMGYEGAKFQNFKIVNLTAILQVKFRIRLADLKVALGEKSCKFDDSRPQVMYYRLDHPKVTLGIFERGKVTLLGAKSTQAVFDAFKTVLPILKQFRRQK